MSDTAITAVIFDIGNVLYDWDRRYLYSRLIPDAAALDHFLDHILTLDWHTQHDAGRELAPMVAELTAAHPEHAELIAHYVPRWLETIPGPVDGSLELVEALDARDVPLYAITNFGVEFWDMFRPTAPIFDRFQDIVVSGAERLIKPDPAIFTLALNRFGLRAEQALFIDDRADNVAAAAALGMHTHHFRGSAGLGAHLRDLALLG